MDLDELSLKYHTDKGSIGHLYTPHYERIFGAVRLNVESVLEIGVADGASLKMWRDWFPCASIYGVDMNPAGVVGHRIECFECEQTDSVKLSEWVRDKRVEIIIDDASHEQYKTFVTLECLWPLLQPRAWYVIEDMTIHSFPLELGKWIGQRAPEVKQVHIFKNRAGSSLISFIQKQ